MIFADDCLAERRILVTGASSGIGREAAIQLSRIGARVILLARDEARLEQTLEAMAGAGHEVRRCDLANSDDVAVLLQQLVTEGGPLSGMFHAAGSSLVLPAKLTKQAHINELFGAGVYGALGLARAAARKGAIVDGASLVFMSSVSSWRGRSGMVAYSAAKAAVDGMIRALAAELADRRVRVNSIVSGAVTTEMHDQFVESVNETIVENYRKLHMLGFGSPLDVANAVIFLLSDAATWITGASIPVDGGYTAK